MRGDIIKVLKFGGSSMATPESIKSAAEIILSQKESIVVVSAPGKRHKDDTKVTDLLFAAYEYRLKNGRCDAAFKAVEDRLLPLAEGIGVTGLKPYLEQIRHDINAGASLGYTVSRGEYAAALLMRHLIGCEFIDAAELIRFDAYGKPDYAASYLSVKQRLNGCGRAVVPGFYGAMPNGEIKAFSRGGSDVSGAVIAAGLDAEVYENWTDVDGFYFCPLTSCCRPVKELSYRQARRLAYMGAAVLHPDCLPPCEKKNIPIVIKNTFNPSASGTVITHCHPESARDSTLGNVNSDFCRGIVHSVQSYNDKAANSKCTDCRIENGKKSFVTAFSGREGFNALTFHGDGIALKDIVPELEKQGAVVFTALGGVDSYTVVLDGAIPDEIKIKPVHKQALALFTIIGEVTEVIKAVSNLDLSYKLLQAYDDGTGVLLGVAEGELKSAMHILCTALM